METFPHATKHPSLQSQSAFPFKVRMLNFFKTKMTFIHLFYVLSRERQWRYLFLRSQSRGCQRRRRDVEILLPRKL